jgi:putative CocE/NonD family hydrolase
MAVGRVILDRGVTATMRDGTVLVADVYRPDDAGKHPVLLMRTPYDATLSFNAFSALDPIKMALRGYAVVIQDVRGRFASEGDYETYEWEADDGYDTVEWAARQPWSDGKVGMFGLSYMAQCALLAAARRPPSLHAIAPLETPNNTLGGDRYRGGAMQLGVLASWAMQAIVPAEIIRRARQDPNLLAEFPAAIDDVDNLDELMRRLPLVPWPPIDERAGGISPQFDQTVRYEFHPPIPRFYPRDVGVPALMFAGWYDVFLQPDLEIYTAIKAEGGTESARQLSRIVVGPWTHGTPSSTVGELEMGFRSSPMLLDLREDITRLHQRWFDQRLRGKPTGIDDEPPVRLFVMGINRWRDEDEWPLRRAQPQAWHLHAGAGSGDAIRAGGGLSLAPPEASGPSTFCLDPDDPVPTRGGNLLMTGKYLRGPVDQLRTEMRPDVMLFTSEALARPMEVTGRVTLVAWVASETPDADVVARLCDVHPDGCSYNVVDGILRLRFREGLDRERLMTPGEVYRVEVDLWSTAHVFLAGHRLRLHVCASDFPRYDRNPGTGQTSADVDRVLPQRNRLFHEPSRPSHLVLPVVPR